MNLVVVYLLQYKTVLTPPKDYVPPSVEEVNVTADLNGTSANVTTKSSESNCVDG